MIAIFLLCMFTIVGNIWGLQIVENSIAGTEPISFALTPKQLAVQRWFAQLTYLQSTGSDIWKGWGDAVNDLDCDGNTCIRYEISGLAYAAAVMASKTPAYTALSEDIIYDSIIRMINKNVWQYVELFNDFKDQPTYPDPVAYKNIMYSGHLAQMISLFEAITGNTTFSTEGWAFSWGSDSAYPQPMPYTSAKLMQVIAAQTQSYEGALGGVPCEPDSIFVICNNYPMNAFLLYDTLHGTDFAAAATEAWQGTVQEKGVNRAPPVPDGDNNFFNLDYLIHPLGIWEPVASVGSDMWALAWLRPWWNASASADAATLTAAAYASVLNSTRWVVTISTSSSPSPRSSVREDRDPQQPLQGQKRERENEKVMTLKEAYLQPGDLGNKLFPFSPEITTSFFPMIYKQLDTDSSDAAGFPAAATAAVVTERRADIDTVSTPSVTNRTTTDASSSSSGSSSSKDSAQVRLQQVYQYFERHYARFFDSDGDGVRDSYQYNTARANCSNASSSGSGTSKGVAAAEEDCETGDYSIWATANLVLGMVLPPPAEDADYLRRLFQGTPLHQEYRHKPKVQHVAYPHVMVSSAYFEDSSYTIKASAAAADAQPSTSTQQQHQQQSCYCPTAGVLKLSLLPGDNAPTSAHLVLLSSGCSDLENNDPGTHSRSTAAVKPLSPCVADPAAMTRFINECTAITLNGAPFPAANVSAVPVLETKGRGWFAMAAPGWASDQVNERDEAQHFEVKFCST